MDTLRYLGHAGFEIVIEGKHLLVDLFLKESEEMGFERLYEAPIKPEDIRKAHIILVTHEHFDHFEPSTINEVAKHTGAHVVVPEGLEGELEVSPRKLHAIRVGESLELLGIRINAVKAYHPQAAYALGYFIECGEKSIYHAGDTYVFSEMREMNPKIALLPIGGTFTMDVIDAVTAVKLLRPSLVVPMHYNTFMAIRADPLEFKRRVEMSKLARVEVLAPGESIEIFKA